MAENKQTNFRNKWQTFRKNECQPITLEDIDLDTLEAAIRDGVEQTT